MPNQYFEWNRAIIEEYFPEQNEGRLAYLPIDDEEIEALAADYGICAPDEAVESFETAVILELRSHQGGFARLSRLARTWRESDFDAPPYLAGLGFCVLAGSRMSGDEELNVSSTNYYVRLNELLGRPESGIPPNFELLKIAWDDLGVWLDQDCDGARGKSTVPLDPGRHRHIGYPLSQCLLRASDRRRLPDFFQSRGLESKDASQIGDPHLFQLLRSWSARTGSGLSRRARIAISQAKDRDLEEIVETVRRELAAWDGSLRDSRGRKRYAIRLALQPRGSRSAVALVAQLPTGMENEEWRLSDTDEMVLVPEDPASPGWSKVLPIQITSALLDSGVNLSSGRSSLVLEPRSAIPFRAGNGPFLDWFMSQSQTTMWSRQFALVRRDAAESLARYLARQTKAPVIRTDDASSIPVNWALLGPFQFESQPQPPPEEFSQFSPRSSQSLSMRGGLPIRRGIYLAGSEPDLLVSFDASDPERKIEIDGEARKCSQEFSKLRLCELDLSVGEHVVSAGVSRSFSTTETLGDVIPPSAGSLGFGLTRHREYHPASALAQPVPDSPKRGEVFVSGATLRGFDEDLPFLERIPFYFKGDFARCIVIGKAPGEIAEPLEVKAPRWLNEIGLRKQFQFVEVNVDFAPAWMLSEDSKGLRKVAKLASVAEPAEARMETSAGWFDAIFGWENTESSDPEVTEEWNLFTKAVKDES